MAVAARYDRAAQHRRAMLAKVHIARKELAIEDGAYRAMLERLTGHVSSADCSEAQLAAVLAEFKAKGWTPRVITGSTPDQPVVSNKKPRPADHPSARKARALWISLHQLGVVRDASERALEAFAARQLKVERLQWADQAQCYKLIEALKAMGRREGWIQDLEGVPPAGQVRRLREQLLVAQTAKLNCPAEVERLFGEVGDLSDDQLSEWIATNGEILRREARHA